MGKNDEQTLAIEEVLVTELRPNPENPRENDEAVQSVADSISAFGWQQPLVVTPEGLILAGHTRYKAAVLLGLQRVPVVRFVGSEAQAKAFSVADNRTGELAKWNDRLLADLLQELQAEDQELFEATGYSDEELDELLAELEAASDEDFKEGGAGDDAEAEEPPKEPVSRLGDVWILGNHRLLCGDATDPAQLARLFGEMKPELILTDPPYCSGGFQEAGKARGSVGTDVVHKPVANDRLSTRGYQALLGSVIGNIPSALYVYCFTDWRMWIHCFDVAESRGFGVRSMIVWDKGTPGMGRGWRAQHELILWGTKDTPPFDKHASGVGNVIQAQRTGNEHHTTQKPLEVIEALLANVPFCGGVCDPFAGSGTTIVACENLTRRCFAAELDPAYVDVAIDRWQRVSGREAQIEDTGLSFANVALERRS